MLLHRTKNIFSLLFIVLVFLLILLPFMTTFNDILTRFMLQFGWYRKIESLIVPFEIKTIVATLRLINVDAIGSPTTLSVMANGSWQKVFISWNCVGWQSLILLVLTFVTGFQGNYQRISKIEAIIIGTLGTVLVNIIRLVLVVLIFKFVGYLPAIIFHNYIANISIIAWLFFYWWFVYRFVLETKDANVNYANVCE